jgi:hypothetical protein
LTSLQILTSWTAFSFLKSSFFCDTLCPLGIFCLFSWPFLVLLPLISKHYTLLVVYTLPLEGLTFPTALTTPFMVMTSECISNFLSWIYAHVLWFYSFIHMCILYPCFGPHFNLSVNNMEFPSCVEGGHGPFPCGAST